MRIAYLIFMLDIYQCLTDETITELNRFSEKEIVINELENIFKYGHDKLSSACYLTQNFKIYYHTDKWTINDNGKEWNCEDEQVIFIKKLDNDVIFKISASMYFDGLQFFFIDKYGHVLNMTYEQNFNLDLVAGLDEWTANYWTFVYENDMYD